MSKIPLTVYVCTGKECRKVWRHAGESPGKWLKRQVEERELPFKLNVVKTECMDHCEHAACLCIVCGARASFELEAKPHRGADRIIEALVACALPRENDG